MDQLLIGPNSGAILNTAWDAIQAGDDTKAMNLLVEAVRQNPMDPHPWLMMVWLAPARDTALDYLRQAEIFNAEKEAVHRAQEWIDTRFPDAESNILAHQAITQETLIEREDFSQADTQETKVNKENDTKIDSSLISAAEDLIDNAVLEPIEIKSVADKQDAVVPSIPILTRLHKYIPFVYLVVLALAELLASLIAPIWGMILHGVILAALVIQGSLYDQGRERTFLLSLSFAPLIRLVSFTTPLASFSQIYWYAIVGLPLFLAAISLIKATDLKKRQIGWKIGSIPSQFLISLTGVGLGYVEYLILKPEPLVSELSWQAIIIPALILLIFTGLLEELIFRGIFQYIAIRHLGRFGLYYVSLVFAVLHIGYLSVLDFGFVFLVAMIFGFFVQRTGSILGVTIAHGLTNIGLFLVFPFTLG